MSKVCTDLRQALPVQRNIEFAENRISEDSYADNFGDNRKSEWYLKFTKWMGEKRQKATKSIKRNVFGKTDVISVDEQRKYLYSEMSRNEADQKMLVTNIEAMLTANPNVVPHFAKWVQSEMNLLDSKLMRERFPEAEIKMITRPDGVESPHLDTLPHGFLKVIHAELYEWINGGLIHPKTTGILHTLQIELLSPTTMERRDSSGLIADMNGNLQTWNGTAESRAQDFYNDSSDGRRPGINQISNKIKQFADSFGNMPIDHAFDIFFRFKRGEAFINPNDGDKLYISNNYVRPSPGEQHKWIRDEDSIMPYTWKDESDNNFEVIISDKKPDGHNQSQQEMLLDANSMLIKWYDSVFKTMQVYTESHNKRRAKIDEIARINGTAYLIDEVSDFAIFSPNIDIQGLSQIDKQEKYYMTRMYYQDHIPRLMEEALEDPSSGMKIKRDLLTSKIKEWDPTVEHTKAEMKKQRGYEKRLNELNADIYILEEKLNTMDEGLYDPLHKEFIQAQNILKNFKHVTNMINPEHARTDGNVLTDYIDANMRTVMRNEVSLDLMEALATKGHEAKPGVVDYAINHYKSAFYFPDAKTTYMGMKTDAATWARRLQNIGMPVTANSLSRFSRTVSSYMIFNALNGPMQGMTNYSNYILKIHEMGVDRMTHILGLFDKNPEYWNKLAGKAGVTQFTSFVEGYVQRGLREDEVAAMKGEMNILKDEIARLEKSGNPTRLNRKIRQYNSMKGVGWNSRASEAAQWAITRKIHYKKNENIFMKSIKTTLGEQYSKWFPSIADTEENLRTLSFMIGVQNYIERHPGKKAEDPDAIKAGIDYTQRTDFGLSHQHVGLAFRGPLGGFLTRMRIWHVQRFGHDIQVYKQAFRETRPEMLIKNEDGTYELDQRWLSRGVNTTKGLYGMFRGITRFGSPATKQRLDKKYMARARSHFWMHAVATGIMDFGIYALAPPGTGTMMSFVARGSRAVYYRSPMGRGMNGFGSSVMSLSFGAMHLLGIMASGGFDDKEYTAEEFFMKYAYQIPFLGLGASILLDLTLHMAHDHRLDALENRQNHLTKHIEKLKVASPGGRVPHDIKDLLEGLGALNKKGEILETMYKR